MQIDPGSLGGFLRQERERQQVTLQDISAVTKIQLRFLEALEHNEHDQLPSTPFVVGFLRAYAQALGLDAPAILTAYHASAYGAAVPEAQPSPLAALPKRPRGKRITSLVGLIVVLGAVLWLLRTENNQQTQFLGMDVSITRAPSDPLLPAEPPSPRLATVVPGQPLVEAEPVPASLQPLEELPSNLESVQPPETDEAPPVIALAPGTSSVVVAEPPAQTPAEVRPATPERLVLQARALQKTWLRVKIDGETHNDILLTSGKSASWEANEQFLLTVGNVQGTRVTLNGQEIALPTARSNVIRDFLLTRQLLN